MSSSFNFATAFGWHSVAAAAVFAVLYSPLAASFLYYMIRERRRVLSSLTLFCIIRVAAFVMRAISTGIPSAGENESLFIATEVFFSIGFFGLLYSAYSLVMDRLDFCDNPILPVPILGNILHLLRKRRLFRLTLLIPMALGIAGINETSSNPDSSTGTTLRKASTIVFLVLTTIPVLQTVVLIKAEREGGDTLKNTSSSFGATHASILYGIISLLLLIREIFTVATISNISEANNEHFWYPLVALPEFLCVIIFAIPGVIPSKEAQEEKGIPMCQNGSVPAR
ncbi:hypothetical protein BT96DRAFT_873610 [Gymnopus androsaceus JB14]|uniref:RTA1-domain-containing protein n=1 Tax=Gymnopus androsaceus JB14 TaxID=1447944 RepID=A0A6A4IIK3_9AGAR|nr:hypothetical protein BT96DRAFT_873610 [Gymnopus androsaceus JB14]